MQDQYSFTACCEGSETIIWITYIKLCQELLKHTFLHMAKTSMPKFLLFVEFHWSCFQLSVSKSAVAMD